MTLVKEMETGEQLKVESIPSLEPDGEEHLPTELVQKKLEDSLPESTGGQDWVLPKKKKKKKKNRNTSVSELQDGLHSAPTTLDYSLNAETKDENNPSEQSQAELTKVTESERGSTEDNGHQTESCSPLDLDQNLENGATLCSDQALKKGGKNVAVATEEKVEKEKANAVDNEQLVSSGEQHNLHSSTIEKSLEDRTALTSVCDTNPHVPTGDAENISDLTLHVTSSENTSANASMEDQNQIKLSLPESETKQTHETKQMHKTEVEKETKQERNDSDAKKMKLEEKATEKGNTHEKAATQIKGTEEKGKAAASNQKKQQSDQNNKKEQINRSQVDFRDGITVYFHAILSKDFKLDHNNDKVFVRAQGISGYKNWKDNVCELTCSKDLGKHGHLFDGCVVIAKDNMNKHIPYKYCVWRGKKEDWELIYKDCQEGCFVNRCMYIRSDELSGTDWHQYDDIVCVKSDDWWSRIKDHIPGIKNSQKYVVKGKQLAAEVMLESLFSMLHTWTPINVKNFFQQLRQFYLVNSEPMIYENKPKKWAALEFGDKEVKQLILDYLKKTASQLLNQNSTNSPSHNTVVQNKLGLALIILLLGARYSLPASKSDWTQLCKILCLEKPRADIVNEIHCVKDVFPESLHVKPCLIDLYNNCIEEQIHEWLWTIPVLHVFSTSSDFDCVQVNSLLESEEKWAGLEGLIFAEYRNKQQQSNKKILLQLMKEKKNLVEGDRALFRSWFSLLPLKDLAEFITDFSTDLLDCLLGTFHRLKNVEVTYNYEVVEEVLEKVLCIPWNNQNR